MNKRTDPDFTMGDVWTDIAERYGLVAEPTDDDSLTSNEFAKKYNISRDRAMAIIHQEHEEGRMEVTEKTIFCIGGRKTMTVPAYKALPKKERADGQEN